jgi:methylthioribose-1-phosphate isomerase
MTTASSATGAAHPETLRWSADHRALEILDQTRLPEAEVYLAIRSAEEMAQAIRELRVRGAPAIGVAAALAIALDAAYHTAESSAAFRAHLSAACALLQAARPTAVNLSWAVGRMRALADSVTEDVAPGVIACKLWGEADAIHAEDRQMCAQIGAHALPLLTHAQPTVLTHCNAGALATTGIGTALAPVYLAHGQGRDVQVFASETRPLLQGSRITAWELARAGVPVTVVTEGAIGALLGEERVDAVLVGADRIAANGDVANKIGTYNLAVLARRHGVPLYVLAPNTSIDPATPTGAEIPIEQRAADEVRCGFGRLTAPAEVPVFAPAFDVTPAELIDAIVTDRGVFRAPYHFR